MERKKLRDGIVQNAWGFEQKKFCQIAYFQVSYASCLCTRSSVGRVSVSEAEGRWFDPSRVR